MTATLPDGTTRTVVVDENGNGVITGVNLRAGETITLSDGGIVPSPTWVQQAGFGLAPCAGSGTMRMTTQTFSFFGVAYVDFRYNLSGGGVPTTTPGGTGTPRPIATGTAVP